MLSENSSRLSMNEVPQADDDVMHIPGENGAPYFGLAREFLASPRALNKRMRETYGPVFRTRFLGQYTVGLSGAEGLQMVMLDRDKNFSSQKGWHHTIGRLFFRGLMLLDFDEHRYHRRIMQTAFKKDAMAFYLDSMHEVSASGMRQWRNDKNFQFYPAIKQLTLDNAAKAFLGLELGQEADALNKAFIDTVAASLALVRVPVPGLALSRGLRGRKLLEAFFRRQIPARRASDQRDMFTQLCHATDDDGRHFSDDDVVDHMIFLMMAAHDTVTSSLTTAAYGLAMHPEWQQQLRDEAAFTNGEPLQYAQLPELSKSEWVFNEALRMWGPVPLIPRRTVRAFEYEGVRIPANVQVGISPDAAHYDERFWSNPGQFDPKRFSPERAEHKSHPFAFAPYGGGAHKCIGMHFGQILAKVVLLELVSQYDISIDPHYELDMQPIPIPKPRDGLPLTLTPRT